MKDQEEKMISSKELMEKTGIKNIRVLTNWYKKGIIPKPVVQTHPGGRGKMAFFPNSTLERCLKIVQKMEKGIPAFAAAAIIDSENEQKVATQVERETEPKCPHEKPSRKIKCKDGSEVDLHNIFLSTILIYIKKLVSDTDIINTVINRITDENVYDLASAYISAGYNPILLYDGNELRVEPDFLIGLLLSDTFSEKKIYLMVPLLQVVCETRLKIGLEPYVKINVFPAPIVKVAEGKNRVSTREREIVFSGPMGFKLVPRGPKVVTY